MSPPRLPGGRRTRDLVLLWVVVLVDLLVTSQLYLAAVCGLEHGGSPGAGGMGTVLLRHGITRTEPEG